MSIDTTEQIAPQILQKMTRVQGCIIKISNIVQREPDTRKLIDTNACETSKLERVLQFETYFNARQRP